MAQDANEEFTQYRGEVADGGNPRKGPGNECPSLLMLFRRKTPLKGNSAIATPKSMRKLWDRTRVPTALGHEDGWSKFLTQKPDDVKLRHIPLQ